MLRGKAVAHHRVRDGVADSRHDPDGYAAADRGAD
jgi:hypothetical protein